MDDKTDHTLAIVKQAVQNGAAIVICCRIERGKIICEFNALSWPDDNIDRAKELIVKAIDQHRAKTIGGIPTGPVPLAAGPPQAKTKTARERKEK